MIFIQKKAFTLIEMLIVIVLIGIIILMASSLNFNNIGNKQKLESFYYEIKSKIETVKNNSLIGKGIGTNLIVPKEWKIDFSSGSNIIPINYHSGATWNNYEDIKIDNLYKIEKVECVNLIDFSVGTLTGNTGSLIIQGSAMYSSGCNNTNYKILRITSSYKGLEKTLEINTVSNVLKDL